MICTPASLRVLAKHLKKTGHQLCQRENVLEMLVMWNIFFTSIAGSGNLSLPWLLSTERLSYILIFKENCALKKHFLQ